MDTPRSDLEDVKLWSDVPGRMLRGRARMWSFVATMYKNHDLWMYCRVLYNIEGIHNLMGPSDYTALVWGLRKLSHAVMFNPKRLKDKWYAHEGYGLLWTVLFKLFHHQLGWNLDVLSSIYLCNVSALFGAGNDFIVDLWMFLLLWQSTGFITESNYRSKAVIVWYLHEKSTYVYTQQCIHWTALPPSGEMKSLLLIENWSWRGKPTDSLRYH